MVRKPSDVKLTSPRPISGPDGLLCPRCKSKNGSNAEFCIRCGFSFRQTHAAEELPVIEDQLVGRVINGKYRVLSVLGEGGFGVVYKVRHLLFEGANVFALKQLHPTLSQDKQFRLRFLREAGLAMSLVHENTIQIREFGQTESGDLFFTMDYCEGEPLKDVLKRERFLTVNRALHIVQQILLVMQQAHSRGIIHRDLKPENIFLERAPDGRDFVKVGDFGLAKSVTDEPSADLTRGGIVGTPRYMSPEQAKGSDHLDGRSDLYSIGVILHEMLYGDVPGGGGQDDAAAVRRGDTPVRTHAVPSGVYEIVETAIQEPREKRFQTADDFLAAVNELPEYTPTYIEPSQRRKRPRRWLRRVSAALVVLVLLFGAALFSGAETLRGWIDQVEKLLHRGGAQASDTQTDATLEPFAAPLRIETFLKFKTGEELVYRTSVGSDKRFTYHIVDEPNPGEYVVIDQDGREVRWIVDPQKNELIQKFTTLDPETGTLTRAEETVHLRLPRSFDGKDFVVVDGHQKIYRAPEEFSEKYKRCLLVETPEGNRWTKDYYYEGVGLVGTVVLEMDNSSETSQVRTVPIYRKELVERKHVPLRPHVGGIGASPSP